MEERRRREEKKRKKKKRGLKSGGEEKKRRKKEKKGKEKGSGGEGHVRFSVPLPLSKCIHQPLAHQSHTTSDGAYRHSSRHLRLVYFVVCIVVFYRVDPRGAAWECISKGVVKWLPPPCHRFS